MSTQPWAAAETIRCATGSGRTCRLALVSHFDDRSGRIGEVRVARCVECGIGVTLPRLADVSVLYADRSSQDFQPHTRGLARLIKRVAFRRQAAGLLKALPEKPALVVDFGCGSGLLTRSVAECLGSGTRVIAADFHPLPPPDLGKVEYMPFERLTQIEGCADLVLALHCIEHDDDPVGLLSRIVRLARPGGLVMLEVPNVDCRWASIFGPRWDAWYVPYHRVHFGRESLRRVAVASGLEVLVEYGVSIPTMGRTLAHAVGVRPTLPFLLATIALQPVQRAVELATREASALRLLGRAK